jgi:hypothetical protein
MEYLNDWQNGICMLDESYSFEEMRPTTSAS